MTISELRQQIHVTHFEIQGPRTRLNYRKEGEWKYLLLPTINIIEELIAIGSIDSVSEFEGYQLSQWDGLNLAIRYEYAKTLEEESGMIDINKAIDKLK